MGAGADEYEMKLVTGASFLFERFDGLKRGTPVKPDNFWMIIGWEYIDVEGSIQCADSKDCANMSKSLFATRGDPSKSSHRLSHPETHQAACWSCNFSCIEGTRKCTYEFWWSKQKETRSPNKDRAANHVLLWTIAMIYYMRAMEFHGMWSIRSELRALHIYIYIEHFIW